MDFFLKKSRTTRFFVWIVIMLFYMIFFRSWQEITVFFLFLVGSALYWYMCHKGLFFLFQTSTGDKTLSRIEIRLNHGFKRRCLGESSLTRRRTYHQYKRYWLGRNRSCLSYNRERKYRWKQSLGNVLLLLWKSLFLIFLVLAAVHFIGHKVLFCVLGHVVLQSAWTLLYHRGKYY
jgi:hypothetical protein